MESHLSYVVVLFSFTHILHVRLRPENKGLCLMALLQSLCGRALKIVIHIDISNDNYCCSLSIRCAYNETIMFGQPGNEIRIMIWMQQTHTRNV